MHAVSIVAVLAIAQYFAFGVLVGVARGRYGVKAPAQSGHEMFDRAMRVQMNTLEQLVALLPAMFLALQYWPGAYVAACGVVYLIGRTIYWRSYMADPGSRTLGFLLTVAPTMVLMVATVIGASRAWGRF